MSRASSDSWRPILHGPLAERAWAVLDEIAEALVRTRRRLRSTDESYPVRLLRGPTLSSGSSGSALFFTYLHQARPGRGHDDTAVEYLEAAVQQIGHQSLPLKLFEGFLSAAWVAEHMAGRAFEADAEEDFNDEIDEILLTAVGDPGRIEPYDLLTGLVGFGVYALDRLPRAAARESVAAILGALEARVEEKPPGLTWWTPPDPGIRIDGEVPRGHYNLGVAHGVPGVVGLLAELAHRGIERARVSPLLAGAVEWLLSLELEDHESSFFCDRLVPGQDLYPTRGGWCYGDPGIVSVLLNAARVAARDDWREKALAMARVMAVRPFEKTQVVDGGLCHGSAGVAHMLNRLFQATGEAAFRDAARRWFEKNLEMRRPGEGFAGYAMWSLTRGEVVWRDEPGFLTGAAGIGLALLAALTPVEPAWDRVMLLSIPDRAGAS